MTRLCCKGRLNKVVDYDRCIDVCLNICTLPEARYVPTHARVNNHRLLMLGLHRIATILGPIYELKNSGFLGLVSSCCWGETDIRVNKKCIIGQVIRVTCDRTTRDLRARTPFVSLSA